jgi:signal peptidase II
MKTKYILFGGLALIALVGDLVTKGMIIRAMQFGEVVEVTSFFNLVHARNPGAAFGFLAGASESFRAPFFFTVTIVAFAVIGMLVVKALDRQLLYVSGLGLVLGGAAGNFVDRIRFGYVVDFLDVYWGSFHWPAFNVADIAITVGVGFLLIDAVREGIREKRMAKLQVN